MAAIPIGLVGSLALVLDAIPATAQSAPLTNETPQPVTGSEQPILLVNPATGNDATADGSEQAPFKTIAQALEAAKANTVIQLAEGIYSVESGESFPLRLKSGVTIQGNPQTRGAGIVIKGNGLFLSPTFARQNITILGMNQAAVVGVTVINPSPQGYGVWVESTSPTLTDNTFTESGHDGISVVGSSAPLVRNNYFYKNGANGITIYGKSRPEVRENIFEQTGFGININQKATPLIVGNRITGNIDGIVVQAKARPVLRNNSVEGNQRDGLVAIAQSQPDLGTATEPGGNFFLNNGQFDVNGKATSQVIPARGNELKKTIGNLDGTGAIALQSGQGEVVTQSEPTPTAASQPSSEPPPANPEQLPAVIVAQSKPIPIAVSRPSSEPTSANRTSPRAKPLSLPPIKQIQPVAQSSAATPARSEANSSSASPVSTISAASFPTPAALKRAAADQSNRVTPPVFAKPTPAKADDSAAIDDPEGTAAPRVQASAPSPTTARTQTAESVGFTARTAGPPQWFKVASTSRRKDTAAVQQARQDRSRPVPAAKPVVTSDSSSLKIPTATTPIDIPVPPPESTLAVSSAPTKALASPSSRASTPAKGLTPPSVSESGEASPEAAINIPVPPPDSSSAASVPVPQVASRAAVAAAPGTATNLLPVPGPAAPIGNVGSTPTAEIYQVSRQRSPSSSVETVVAKLRYRVVVSAESDQQQEQIRAVVPDAFWTSINGRLVMQVGAFGDRANASEMVQTLAHQGLDATIEQRD